MANVRLGEHYEHFVEQLVASGRYSTVSEVMRDSLRLLEDKEKERELRMHTLVAEIQKGIDSGDAGLFNSDDIKRRGRKILARQKVEN